MHGQTLIRAVMEFIFVHGMDAVTDGHGQTDIRFYFWFQVIHDALRAVGRVKDKLAVVIEVIAKGTTVHLFWRLLRRRKRFWKGLIERRLAFYTIQVFLESVFDGRCDVLGRSFP